MKKRIILASLALLIALSGCSRQPTLTDKINSLAKPYAFSLLTWEVDMLSQEIDEHIRHPYAEDNTDAAFVVGYFDLVARENELRQQIGNIQGGFVQGSVNSLQADIDALSVKRQSLEREAEEILARQMSRAAAELGIYTPLDPYWNAHSTFPPVKMRLQEPPQLLVVSPRDRIDRIVGTTLKSDTTQPEAAALENSIEQLDVSALVVGLGGIATYPSFVANNYGLRTALDIAAEEWFHQYLFFRPLGFRYALDELGISQPLDVVIMNETMAGMVAGELATEVVRLFYAAYFPQVKVIQTALQTYDFYGELCNTRGQVDVLLSQGKVAEAEAYMEQRRLEFADHGYYIRKLNQAYFAFYGCYANQPGFENPIGKDLQTLRSKSASLASFVQLASSFTSRADLTTAVS